jgi:hypothetical protein
VNLAISTRAKNKGIDHLGIQVHEEGELTELREWLKAGDMPVVNEGETVCCYAVSDKSWMQDPSGIPWEAYRKMEDASCSPANSIRQILPAAATDGSRSNQSSGSVHEELVLFGDGGGSD